MYVINHKLKTPLHMQLYTQIKEDIIQNMNVNDKLPSIRKLASLYKLSKTTIQSAYSQLLVEGFIESKPKIAYVVSDMNFDTFKSKDSSKLDCIPNEHIYKYDFFPACLSKDSFPLKLWKHLYNKVMDESLDFGKYHDGQGEYGLRIQIAKYLRESRGVNSLASEIIICSGFSDSMGLLAKLVKDKFHTLSIENPGYHVARKVFESYSYDIKKISVTKNGIDLDELEVKNSNLVYITPSHQYPTGVSMPIANRLKCIEYINKVDGLIIEDDYDSELTYTTRPIPSLQGLDTYDKVIYLGTFAKSLSPAIRVSYMVLPKHLIKAYTDSFDSHFPRVCLSTQKTLELFMSQGHWEKHLRRMRVINKKKHNLMLDTLKKNLGSLIKIEAEGAGLAILINPNVAFDMQKLNTLSIEHNIKLYFAKQRCGGDYEAIRMGFGGFDEDYIVEAIDAFSEVFKKCILKDKTDV